MGVLAKWRASCESLNPCHFEIKEDPATGFYLYVFEGERCVRDYLQDTLEIAIDTAFEDYGVPRDAWRKIED
jgi:hypothetical protein